MSVFESIIESGVFTRTEVSYVGEACPNFPIVLKTRTLEFLSLELKNNKKGKIPSTLTHSRRLERLSL